MESNSTCQENMMNKSGDENVENFQAPQNDNILDQTMECEHSDLAGIQQDGKKHPATPAIQRLHTTLRSFNVHSPSDAIMSPCSQKLNEAARIRKGHQIHQQAVQNAQNANKYGVTKKRPLVNFDDSTDEFKDEVEQETEDQK